MRERKLLTIAITIILQVIDIYKYNGAEGETRTLALFPEPDFEKLRVY
jgi:hypothetical protein